MRNRSSRKRWIAATRSTKRTGRGSSRSSSSRSKRKTNGMSMSSVLVTTYKSMCSQTPDFRFREKYHPEESQPLRAEITRRRGELVKKFASELAKGKYDGANF